MSAKLDEFKEFVKKHPLMKLQVMNKEKTWQQLYEDFVIMGEESFTDDVKEGSKESTTTTTSKGSSQTEDMIKTIMGYVKKIDPDQVTKTVTSIQKVLELISGFSGAVGGSALAKKSTGDPLFDRRFDDWY